MKKLLIICAAILCSCTAQQPSYQLLLSSAQCGNTYNRSACFGSWIDEDGDGLNTRQEALNSALYSKDGENYYYDPYTGQMYRKSSILDADHIVPLKWAWDHGADKWMQEKRIAFANDSKNVMLVHRTPNRSKGDAGLEKYLPPNLGICSWYIEQFLMICKKYQLPVPDVTWAEGVCENYKRGFKNGSTD